MTYEVIYIPRIHDEVAIAKFNNLDDAKKLMQTIKENRPKAFPHHYIWDKENETKVNYI